MLVKELTLEELIAKQQDAKVERLAKNAENIVKITERSSAAEGAEKVRLEALLELHKAHTSKIEAIDPVALANERFAKLQERKDK